MNRVILKTESKKKENEKKKEKPIRITKEIIKTQLISHFKNHIGESEKTTQEEIFQIVIGVNSSFVNNFSRFYFWEQIEKCIRELRRKNICFIIKKHGNYFVLKHQEEADYYKNLCDKAIGHMENAKERADDWVEQERWRDIDKNREEKETEKVIKTQDEKIVEDIDKAKTKVIKLWKGEK